MSRYKNVKVYSSRRYQKIPRGKKFRTEREQNQEQKKKNEKEIPRGRAAKD